MKKSSPRYRITVHGNPLHPQSFTIEREVIKWPFRYWDPGIIPSFTTLQQCLDWIHQESTPAQTTTIYLSAPKPP